MTAVALSYLYVPGDSGEMLNRAETRGADAVIADLEDGVAAAGKSLARDQVREWMSVTTLGPTERWTSLNSGDQGLGDLAHVFGPGLRGVCLPKVSSLDDVERVDRILVDLEKSADRTTGDVRIMPIIESADAVANLTEIAGGPRVHRLQIGELDLAADLGMEPGRDELELLPVRSAVAAVSAARLLVPPVGAVSAEVRDLPVLETSTRRLRRLGFYGRAAIHPAQIPIIHRVFEVTAHEIAAARRLLSSFDAASSAGDGATLDENGRMIDEAVVRRSRMIIAREQNQEARR